MPPLSTAIADPHNPDPRSGDLPGQAALVAISPHSRALEIEPVAAAPGAVAFLLPYAPWLRRAREDVGVHEGAVASVLDTAASMAAYSALPERGRIATLDMRCDFHTAPPAADIIVSAGGQTPVDDAMFVGGTFTNAATGALFGRAALSFSRSPMGSRREGVPAEPTGTSRSSADAADFAEWLHLPPVAPTMIVAYRAEFAAMDIAPRFHGGALAAVLTGVALAKAQAALNSPRLVTMTASFHVFADASPLSVSASDWAMRRTLASINLPACRQDVASRLNSWLTSATASAECHSAM